MLFWGMIHLRPLPAGPRPASSFSAVLATALADAAALVNGGVDGIFLENFGDAPFPAGPVEPHVVAFAGILAARLRDHHPSLKIGINLLRNDARGALGAAAAADADFIRVNVHTGAMLTDQGILQGKAHETLRYRRELGSNVKIAADVLVKHAVPLGNQEIGTTASDTYRRGGADVLIVTGQGTGHGADPAEAMTIRAAVPEAPLWLGSGLTPQNAAQWRELIDGAIVGTYLHTNGDISQPIDAARVRAVRQALSG